MLSLTRGDLALAGELAEVAIQIYTRIGDRSSELRTRRVLATIAIRQGRVEDASRQLLDGVAAADRSDLAEYRFGFRMELADLALRQGHHEEALAWAEKSLAVEGMTGRRLKTLGFNRAGRAALALGRLDEATAFFEEALAAAERVGTARHTMRSLAALGDVSRIAGDLNSAREWYARALGDARDSGPYALGSAQKLLQVGLLAAAADLHDCAVELIAAGRALDDPHRAWAFENQKVETALQAGKEVLGQAEFDAAYEGGRALDWETASAKAAALLAELDV